MRWLNLLLEWQYLSSGTNFHECEAQSFFKIQADS
jgi:hypothetical protein